MRRSLWFAVRYVLAVALLSSVLANAPCARAQSISLPRPYMAGVNLPWWNFGTDFGTGPWGKFTDWNSINNMFAQLHAEGANYVAWQVMVDGRYAPDFNADGTCYLDSQFLPDIDHAMQIAHNNNVTLMFNLLDPGGMWGPYNSNYGAPAGGHAAMVTDTRIRQSFLDNCLKPLLQRIAASPNRASVGIIDIADEPEWNMAGYGGAYPNLDPALVKQFVQLCAQYIHQYAPGVLATVGSATPNWVTTWKGLGLDIYDFHYYPNFDTAGPGSGLPTYLSLGLDRPCIVGEYATVDTDYIIGSSRPLSAQWYLDTIYNYGYLGSYAWAYSYNDGSAANWSAFQPVYTNWTTLHRLH